MFGEFDPNVVGVAGLAGGLAIAAATFLLQRFIADRSVFYTEARALYDLVHDENVRLREVNSDLASRLALCEEERAALREDRTENSGG